MRPFRTSHGGVPPKRAGEAGKRRPTGRERGAGSADSAQTCQARALDEWQRTATPLDVYLRNGTKIRGVLSSYDAYMIALDAQGQLQAVYKQAILNIIPVGPHSHERPAARRPVIVVKRRSTGPA